MIKKIKIFITYEKGATINRIFAYANVFSHYFDVEVVILATETNSLHTQMLNDNIKLTYVIWDGVVPNNFMARFSKEFLQSRRLSKSLNKSEDIVMVSIPFFSLLFLPFFKKNKAVKIIDIRDLNWEYLPSHSFILRVAKKFMTRLAVKYISKFNVVSVTNTHEEEWILKNTNKKPIVIYNGISKEQYAKLKGLKSNPEQVEKIIISYIGNVGIAQNLVSFINVIRNHKNFEFRIIGDGNDYDSLLKYVATNSISNVILTGRVPFSDIPEYYSQAHVLFAKLDPNYKSAVPSKLFEMLTTNKPIIYSGEGIALKVLEGFDNVFYYHSQKDLENILSDFEKNGFSLSIDNHSKVYKNYIRENLIKDNLEIFTT